jgi:hypothetical protein
MNCFTLIHNRGSTPSKKMSALKKSVAGKCFTDNRLNFSCS